jgi:hypothetical protein
MLFWLDFFENNTQKIGVKKTILSIWTNQFGPSFVIRVVFLINKIREYLNNQFVDYFIGFISI